MLDASKKEDGCDWFIGVKALQARPMQLGQFCLLKSKDAPPDTHPSDPGYLVIYPDGYESWSPKHVFERSYFPCSDRSGGARLRPQVDDVELFVAEGARTRITPSASTVTMLTITGHEFHHTANAGCPEAFDDEAITNIGHGHNMSNLAMCLDFVFSWANNGIDPTGPNEASPTDAPQLQLVGGGSEPIDTPVDSEE